MSMGRDSLLAEAQQKGHIIASHSFSHPNFHTISTGEQTRQVIDTDTILARFMPSGQKFFRYPYGNSTCHANEVLRREGYRIVGWHVDSCDWAFARNGWVTLDQARICGVSPENRSDFVSHVVSSVVKRTGGILLFHDVHQITVRNLESIILRLTERGYSFVSLADQRYRHYLR
jgi:peptidoglycan/xylan/chitin deacetylase (PgdA/CDA1 family)